MKRFLPSNVMLIPFVVHHYDEEEDHNETAESEPTNSTSTTGDDKPELML